MNFVAFFTLMFLSLLLGLWMIRSLIEIVVVGGGGTSAVSAIAAYLELILVGASLRHPSARLYP